MQTRQKGRCPWNMLASWTAVALLGSIAGYSQSGDVIYEGARLIVGDASAPIQNGSFVVRGGRITAIGERGSIKAPAGAAHVDLTGKTVMPTMNNIHAHLGYEGYVSWSVENHTPENVLDHLEREAFYGVGTTMAMGEQPTDFAIEFQRNQLAGKFPPAARFFFAAGMAPPGGGPDALLIQGTGPLHAVYEVSSPEEAVAAVRKIAAMNIKELKFWVDNRDNTRGSRKKMSPEVYRPLIDGGAQARDDRPCSCHESAGSEGRGRGRCGRAGSHAHGRKSRRRVPRNPQGRSGRTGRR